MSWPPGRLRAISPGRRWSTSASREPCRRHPHAAAITRARRSARSRERLQIAMTAAVGARLPRHLQEADVLLQQPRMRPEGTAAAAMHCQLRNLAVAGPIDTGDDAGYIPYRGDRPDA